MATRIVVTGILGILLFGSHAYGQAPTTTFDFLVSWRASALAPDTYRGKVLPTQGSAIAVSMELLRNGVPVDLSTQRVRWLINEDFFLIEPGAQRIVYRTDTRSGVDTIRVQLPDYAGGGLEDVVSIPVVRPEVVIAAPYAERRLPAGEVMLRAVPYFFTASAMEALSFDWEVNGQRTVGSVERDDMLTLDTPSGLPSGTPISVFVGGVNPEVATEIGTKTVRFFTR